MGLIDLIDFLGKKPTLLINKQDSHKSGFGAFVSFFTFLGLFVGFAYFVYKMVIREEVNIVKNEKFLPGQSMSLSKFPISVKIEDKNSKIFEDQDRIVEVYLTRHYDDYEYDEEESEDIPLKACPEEEKKGQLCVQQDKMNFSIWSQYKKTNSSYIKFDFYKCTNTTEKKNCYPSSTIDKKLKFVYISVFFNDYYFDHSNITHPGISYEREEFFASGISPYIRTDMEIGMQNIKYQSDSNLLYLDPKTFSYNYIEYLDISTRIKDNSEDPSLNAFSSIYFNMGTIMIEYERKFQKIPNMLADFGGLMGIVLFICNNIVLFFSNQLFYNQIIDANIDSLYVKSIEKSLLVNVVGGLGKRRGTSSHLVYTQVENGLKNEKDQEVVKTQIHKKTSHVYNAHDNDEFELQEVSPKKLVLRDQPDKQDLSIHSIEDYNGSQRKANPKSEIELVNLSKRDDSPGANFKSDNIVTSEAGLRNKTNVEFRKFKINCCGYFFPTCCFRKKSQTFKQLSLHSKFSEMINEHMDILHISKKFHTLDKINYILCGEEHKNILEKTVNPYLYNEPITDTTDIYVARENILESLKLYEK